MPTGAVAMRSFQRSNSAWVASWSSPGPPAKPSRWSPSASIFPGWRSGRGTGSGWGSGSSGGGVSSHSAGGADGL